MIDPSLSQKIMNMMNHELWLKDNEIFGIQRRPLCKHDPKVRLQMHQATQGCYCRSLNLLRSFAHEETPHADRLSVERVWKEVQGIKDALAKDKIPAAISGSIPAKNRSWSVCRNKLNPQQPCPGKPPASEPWCPSAADPVLASLPSWLEGLSAPSCTPGLNICAFIYSNRGWVGSLEGILIDAVPQSKHTHVTY